MKPETIDYILSKFLSARFWMALLMTISGCYMSHKGTLSTEFATMWGVVVAHYFSRNRPEENPLKGDRNGTR